MVEERDREPHNQGTVDSAGEREVTRTHTPRSP